MCQSTIEVILKKLQEFRNEIDNDDALKKKRKILISVCVVFIALNITGATLEEANTFIFKLKFTKAASLSYLFVCTILYLTLRYFGYAREYHEKLFNFWSSRLLSDYRVLNFNPHEHDFTGLLSPAIRVYAGDEPGIQSPSYKVTGLFKRNLTYDSENVDEYGVDYFYTANIELNRFDKKWTRRKFLSLLKFEAVYQFNAFVKSRENLDLYFPYFVSLLALLSLYFKPS